MRIARANKRASQNGRECGTCGILLNVAGGAFGGFYRHSLTHACQINPELGTTAPAELDGEQEPAALYPKATPAPLAHL